MSTWIMPISCNLSWLPPLFKTKAWFYFGSYRVSASDLLASRSLFLLPFVTNSALLILLWPFAAAGAVTGSSRALPFVGLGGIMPFFSLDFPHTTKYNPTATTAAPIRLITYTIVQKKKKKIVIFFMHFAELYCLWKKKKRLGGNCVFYLPKWSFSDRTKKAMTITIIIRRGLKAVTNTGPMVFITRPCT